MDPVCILFGIMIVLNQRIEPAIGKTLDTIMVIFVCLFSPVLLLSFPFLKLEKYYPSQSLETIPRDIIAIINMKRFKYYKIPENYIITKCFDSSNKILVDKDVLLFFHGNKLRIVNDFTSTIKDFGCFEFGLDEFKMSYGKKGDIVTTEINAEKFYISLRKRAKPYISNRGADVNREV